MKGFRQQPQSSRKDKFREMETELKNMAMSVRINQMMTERLIQNIKSMQEDIGGAFNIVNELQYKVLAVQKALNLDVTQLNALANEQRLKDFSEASDKEDAAGGFTVGDLVKEDSTVIWTSTTTDGSDKGVFRSRIKLAECGVPELINAFMGREVGAKALVKFNGVEHEVELLGIRQPIPGISEAASHPSNGSIEANTAASTPTGHQEIVGNA